MIQSVVPPHAAASMRSVRSSGGSYSGGMSCRMCLVKHLSRASIELSEYLEDPARYQELASCLGDLSCAEDHAVAMGLDREAEEIRSARKSLVPSPSSETCGRLRDMAAAHLATAVAESKARPQPVAKAPVQEDSNDKGG